MVPPELRPIEIRGWGLLAGVTIVKLGWRPSGLHERDRWWAIVAIIAVAVIVAEALRRLRPLLSTPGTVPLLICAAAASIYLCVPETTNQMPMVGSVVTLVTLAELRSRRQLHIGILGLTAGIVLWSGIYGATGRQSALVGALFSMWPIVIVALAALLVPRLAHVAEPVRWLVAALGVAAAVTVARTGALEPIIRPAVVAVLVLGGLSLAAAVAIAVLAPPTAIPPSPEASDTSPT